MVEKFLRKLGTLLQRLQYIANTLQYKLHIFKI